MYQAESRLTGSRGIEPKGRLLAVVAHPDDETVCFATMLQRATEAAVVFATDGAPWNPYFWNEFGSRETYARIRHEEAQAALGAIGLTQLYFMARMTAHPELFADQKLFYGVAVADRLLNDIIRDFRPDGLLTLAYEGGHPDHDVCSFLAAQAGAREGLPVWEAPAYHRSPDGEFVCQQFRELSGREQLIVPSATELQLKLRMAGAYKSQSHIFEWFDLRRELVRPQVSYDYSQPPHLGPLNYETWGFGVQGKELVAAFQAFLSTGARGRAAFR